MNGYYHSNTGDSLAEALMKVENGARSPSGRSPAITLPTGQAEINSQALRATLREHPVTLARPYNVAKAATPRTWTYAAPDTLRDPLMRLGEFETA